MEISDEILDIKDKILGTVKDCEKIILFGSYAYGNPKKDSDYDFYIVLNDKDENPFVVMGDIYKTLDKQPIKTSVDILANYKNKFETHSKMPTIERTIANKGIVLYERSLNGNMRRGWVEKTRYAKRLATA
ncbi:MAG: nucleotidyltransferase domain-containing protein [Chitinispirillales bacterium]|jgi:predicted nucleotidyltransferase|nr:nucleotidyltransferase domain-containing protein [Chitinispirillales bacterium]